MRKAKGYLVYKEADLDNLIPGDVVLAKLDSSGSLKDMVYVGMEPDGVENNGKCSFLEMPDSIDSSFHVWSSQATYLQFDNGVILFNHLYRNHDVFEPGSGGHDKIRSIFSL